MHGPADPADRLRVVWQRVRAAELVELEQVLHPAQEPVGVGERGGVVAADVAPVGQGGEGGQRGRAAQRLVGAAVHQLQQLHGELDVAQPAGTELEFAAGLRGGRLCSTRRRMAARPRRSSRAARPARPAG